MWILFKTTVCISISILIVVVERSEARDELVERIKNTAADRVEWNERRLVSILRGEPG